MAANEPRLPNQEKNMFCPVITVLPSMRFTDAAAMAAQRGGILQHRKGVSVIAPTLLPGYSKCAAAAIKKAA